MKAFYIRITIFSIIALVGYTGLITVSSIYVSQREFNSGNTNSNLLVMGKNNDYDLLITGMSHARMLSRNGNHAILEEILDRKVLNIGVGEGKAGIVNLELYIRYFYNQNNEADEFLYILTPTLLFSDYLDTSSDAFVLEPVDFTFLTTMITSGYSNKGEQAYYYIKSKLNSMWLAYYPTNTNGVEEELESIDTKAVREGMELAYQDGLQEEVLQERKKRLEETLKLINSNNTEVTVIIPPALFGRWSGHDKVVEILDTLSTEYDITYYDFSESILDPKYYYDHHHLNTSGVKHFTENYLKPILQ